MTDFLAFSAAWPENTLKNLTGPNSAELGRERYYDRFNAACMDAPPKAATRVPGVIPSGVAREGFAAHGFVGDFYHRVHINPLTINAGLLTSDTVYDVIIWSGYLDRIVYITDMTPGAQDGIGLDETPPWTLYPLTDILIKLTLTAAGPPTQDTDIVFETSVGDLGLHISASRIVSFPFEPDWQDGFNFAMTFGTIITKLGRRKEQRRAAAAQPSFRFVFTAWYPQQTGRDLAAVLQNAFDRVLALPVFCFGETVIDMPAPASVRLKPFTDNWFLVRRAKIATLYDYRARRQQVLNIAGVDPAQGVIDFVQDIALDRVDVVYPSIPAHLDAYSLSRPTNDIAKARLTFASFIDGGGELSGAPGAPAEFPFAFNFERGLEQKFEMTRSLTGFEGGVEALTPLVSYGLMGVSGDLATFNKADEFKLLDFFAAAQGRRFAFKYVSPVVMFEVDRDYLAGQSEVSVKGRETTILSRRSPLAFWYDDYAGIKTTVTVTGIDSAAGGGVLYFSEPFPHPIKQGAVMGRIYTVRLDQDVLELDYKSSAAAKTRFALQEVLA